jgi:mannose-6-phosphate isomerase-like protein (cupin superfamily)
MSKVSSIESIAATVGIVEPHFVEAAGNKPKRIAEYIGRVASGDDQVSVAHIVSPDGWFEPAQTPEFDEFSLVLRGELHVTIDGRTLVARAGQAIRAPRHLRVQYSTPSPDGAEYVAVCCPAFAPSIVHRE